MRKNNYIDPIYHSPVIELESYWRWSCSRLTAWLKKNYWSRKSRIPFIYLSNLPSKSLMTMYTIAIQKQIQNNNNNKLLAVQLRVLFCKHPVCATVHTERLQNTTQSAQPKQPICVVCIDDPPFLCWYPNLFRPGFWNSLIMYFSTLDMVFFFSFYFL